MTVKTLRQVVAWTLGAALGELMFAYQTIQAPVVSEMITTAAILVAFACFLLVTILLAVEVDTFDGGAMLMRLFEVEVATLGPMFVGFLFAGFYQGVTEAMLTDLLTLLYVVGIVLGVFAMVGMILGATRPSSLRHKK